MKFDIIQVFRKRPRKFRQFFNSFTGGLLSGVIVGMFFSLASKNQYEWIDFKNFGWIQYSIYLFFTIIFALIFYKFGKSIMPDEKESSFFYLNYFSGILSATISALFIIYSRNRLISFIIAISMVILFLIVSYIILKYKKNKSINQIENV